MCDFLVLFFQLRNASNVLLLRMAHAFEQNPVDMSNGPFFFFFWLSAWQTIAIIPSSLGIAMVRCV